MVWANPGEGERDDLIEAETEQPIDKNLLPLGFYTMSKLDAPGMLRVTVTWGVDEEEHTKQVKGESPKFNNVTIDARVLEGNE